MPEIIFDLFSHDFIIRAMVVGLLVSICAALLGVSLVLKRYAMLGEGLSKVGFGTLGLAMALNLTPWAVSIPIVVLAAFLLLRISENSRIKGDSAIALISSSAMAIGVIVMSVTQGMNTDVCNYMFGSILAMSKFDVFLSVTLSIVVMILFIFFYNKIFAITFDEGFSKATGIKIERYNMLIALLTVLTIVVGMRIMGALMISSLIVFPAMTAMRIFGNFKQVIVASAVISAVCFFFGILVSFVMSIPTGASVVAVNLMGFVLACFVSLFRDMKKEG